MTTFKHHIFIIVCLLTLAACKKNDSAPPTAGIKMLTLKPGVVYNGKNWATSGAILMSTHDGNMVACMVDQGANDESVLVKYNPQLQEIWRLTIPREIVTGICETSTGDFITCGPNEPLRVKADGSSWDTVNLPAKFSAYTNIFKTATGNFIYLVGRDFSNNVHVCKYNEQFNLIWQRDINNVNLYTQAIDPSDNLYLQDDQSNTIRKISPQGDVSTIVINLPQIIQLTAMCFAGSKMYLAGTTAETNPVFSQRLTILACDESGKVLWQFANNSDKKWNDYAAQLSCYGKHLFVCGGLSEEMPGYTDMMIMELDMDGNVTAFAKKGNEIRDDGFSGMVALNKTLYLIGREEMGSDMAAVIYTCPQ